MPTRVLFLLLIVVLAIVTLAGTQGSATLKSNPVVSPHETTARLQEYYDFSALPSNKRKASFKNASAKQKSDLWRTHLALFLKRPELNETQKKIILTAISLAKPEHFEVPSSEPRWKTTVRNPLRSLEGRIVSAFSREDAAKIFATLGDTTESARTATCSDRVLFKSINYKPGIQDIPVGGPCDCSTESDWCPIFSFCSAGNCQGSQSGCGTLWSYPCTGLCR